MSVAPFIAASPSPLGRLYEVCGRHLLLHRAGSGGPAVVFLPGAGMVGLGYLNLHQQVSQFTTAVLYDRSGTGWSDDIALPRSAANVAHELHSLLAAAGVAAPYILVGHSLGGAYVRRFAQLYPQDVAGLLFLDPSHEGYLASPQQTFTAQVRQMLAVLPALLNMKKFYRPLFEEMFAAWPDPPRRQLIDYHLRSWRKSLQEGKNLMTEVLGEIAEGGPLPDRPMIVLTAMGLDPFMAPFSDVAYLRELNVFKRGMYADFAASVPGGVMRELPDAGHSTLHTQRPDAVIQALRDLTQAAPRPGPTPRPAPARSPAARDCGPVSSAPIGRCG